MTSTSTPSIVWPKLTRQFVKKLPTSSTGTPSPRRTSAPSSSVAVSGYCGVTVSGSCHHAFGAVVGADDVAFLLVHVHVATWPSVFA